MNNIEHLIIRNRPIIYIRPIIYETRPIIYRKASIGFTIFVFLIFFFMILIIFSPVYYVY
jgi:hypothetical protein